MSQPLCILHGFPLSQNSPYSALSNHQPSKRSLYRTHSDYQHVFLTVYFEIQLHIYRKCFDTTLSLSQQQRVYDPGVFNEAIAVHKTYFCKVSTFLTGYMQHFPYLACTARSNLDGFIGSKNRHQVG